MIYESKRVDYVSRKLASNGTLAFTNSEQKQREKEPTIISEKYSLSLKQELKRYQAIINADIVMSGFQDTSMAL